MAIPAELFGAFEHSALVKLNFSYYVSDPLALRMGIILEGALVSEWVFARDLVFSGMATQVGWGAISVWPTINNLIAIQISGTEGRVLLRLSADILETFMGETCDRVKYGEEFNNLDIGITVARQCGLVT
ncbi:SsgA family sporulation/cell division regulator [Streptomyces microflavus]|uniref:SsgA family sporulation/cell division regulator n=1 Tax=Streptomyces microflavus TaxID=1919 RepID=UPI0033B7B72A